MSEKKDIPQQENISDVLDMLRQSYSSPKAAPVMLAYSPEEDTFSEKAISDEELQAKLKMRFMTDSGSDKPDVEPTEDIYAIDEDFLAEAEEASSKESELVPEEAKEIEETNEIEEIGEVEEVAPETLTVDTAIEFQVEKDTYEEIEIEDDPDDLPWEDEPLASIFAPDEPEAEKETAENDRLEAVPDSLEGDLEDEDITFDQLEDIEDDDEIKYYPIDTETLEGPQEIFEDVTAVDEEPLCDVEQAEDTIAVMHLECERIEREDIESISAEEKVMEQINESDGQPQISFKELISGEPYPAPKQQESDAIDESETVAGAEDVSDEGEGLSDEDFLATLVGQTAAEHTERKVDIDSSEISLLMQFGCEEEIIGRYGSGATDSIIEQAANDGGESTESDREETAQKEDLLTRYYSYGAQGVSLLIKLGVSAFVTFLLLLYEGLPLVGVELPGILNRTDYYVSYVLMGLQVMIFGGLVCYRRIWDGAKRLLTRAPNTYSVISILAVMTLIYDVSVLFAKEGTPHTFHFLIVGSIAVALLMDYKMLLAERRCFEFYFSDVIFDQEEESHEQIERFTLCQSKGKNSTAEKMYSGGLDPSSNVYFPIKSFSAEGFFNAQGNSSKKRDSIMLTLIPSLVISLLIGIFAFVAGGEIWMGFGGMLLSMLLSMPVISALAIWLPFERISARASEEGYSFANEAGMEKYSECDVAVFSDLHLFERCAPSSVNLALYDATAKDVLLGCISAVYSEIGGPMGETFRSKNSEPIGKCKITRIAKIGVEAVVGSNYLVLIGNESFMQRYGISFPKVTFNDERDKVLTLCVSVNGRATARIAARYKVSRVFEMLASRLSQDGIYCAIETMDPMVSTELLSRLRKENSTPVSVVHLNAADYVAKRDTHREKILFAAYEDEFEVISDASRLNLAIALCTAKRMKKLRRWVNVIAYATSALGALIAFAAAGFGWIEGFSGFAVLLYWMIGAGAIVGFVLKSLPDRKRFSLEQYEEELEQINKD